MGAGDSAAERSRLARQQALALEGRATEARATAARFAVAADAERQLVTQLGRLAPEGYHILADRRWPGSRSANVDCVAIGPGGVFIVDSKCWADVTLTARRIARGGRDVTAELGPLAHLVDVTRTALGEVGLPPREVHALVVLTGPTTTTPREMAGVEVMGERVLLTRIVGQGQRLSPEQVDIVLRSCLELFPAYGGPAPAAPASLSRPPRPRREPPALPPQAEPLLTDEELQDAVLAGALSSPIEEWMAFLHPEQARLVRRSVSGPSRIRGAAGTGKSVVGLHRAEWLARTRPDRVLVTSFVSTVPTVLRAIYSTFAPDTVDRVDFLSVHSLAIDLLIRRGIRLQIDPDRADREFLRAWSAVGRPGLLGRSSQPPEYWREELRAVIKGRGLTAYAQYAGLRRVGRRYSLSGEQRVAVWSLYEAYQSGLAAAGIVDFEDVMIRAERLVRHRPPPSLYGSVIVDEVQDVSCVGLRLLHALVGDAPDGLLLIGDGQQAIYPGGFTLTEAGIDVRGRSTVLRRNYRNTFEILRAAEAVVAGDAFSDLDDREELGARDTVVTRHGEEPVRASAPTRQALDRLLVDAIERARALPSVGLGDLAVLVPDRSEVIRLLDLLARHEVDAVALADYTGRPDRRLKVGTYHRAKGLDFKHVFLPKWNHGVVRGDDETEAALRERRERDRRALFVAMTRARDGLWMGRVGT